MEIRIAKHAGFCFGVKNATDALEAEIERAQQENKGRRVYTLGRIIHNDYYINHIKSRGVGEIEREEIPALIAEADRGERISVIIRAHGELADIVRELEACAERNEHFTLLNCTCPYVEKVRRIARENSGEGRVFILLGAQTHPEVEGIMSCAEGEKYVLPDAAALEAWEKLYSMNKDCAKSIVIAAQTTQNLAEWKKSINFIKKGYTNAEIFDTICSVTQLRQEEAASLARESDIMLVIGSSDSSNSGKLRDISAKYCRNVYFVGGAEDCKHIRVEPQSIMSITAGASTPYSLIQEVYQTMNEQTFAELLEASIKTLNTGDIVEGVITAIYPNEIHLDLGTKTTGVIAHDKATSDPQAKLDVIYKLGDVVKAKVIKVSDIDGIATLDKTRVDSEANWLGIVEASETGVTLEGKVVEVVKGGVIININSVRVFIPASLTGVPKDGDLASLVNTTQKVKIIEIKQGEGRKRAYASIRAVLREERKAREDAFWTEIEEGKEYDGEVKSLTDFGAFVDLGGVDGMVHTSELSWRRVKHPSEVVAIGDKIHVYVKAFDREKGRISLGYKTEEMNPWYVFTTKYAEGDVAEVKVVSLMPFGAFAEIVPGCDGLIHISQITDHKIAKPDEVLEVGQVVTAKITSINNENHQVGLSIRALLEEAEDAADVAEDAE